MLIVIVYLYPCVVTPLSPDVVLLFFHLLFLHWTAKPIYL